MAAMSSEKSKSFTFPSLTSSNMVLEDGQLSSLSFPDEDSQEDHQLLSPYQNIQHKFQSARHHKLHMISLYLIILLLLLIQVFTFTGTKTGDCDNPSLKLWSPVNDIVRYKTVTFERYFIDPSPWTRGTKQEKDELWESTYDFGISGISQKEASNLVNATLSSPHDPDTYMIQLEVFHDLHCLNMLRKSLYPEQYPEMVEYYPNGTINHNTLAALHMDHCLDALRQSMMCEADVTPVTFVHNFFGRGIFPNLVATHTCRDFDAIVDWAKEREVKDYQPN